MGVDPVQSIYRCNVMFVADQALKHILAHVRDLVGHQMAPPLKPCGAHSQLYIPTHLILQEPSTAETETGDRSEETWQRWQAEAVLLVSKEVGVGRWMCCLERVEICTFGVLSIDREVVALERCVLVMY